MILIDNTWTKIDEDNYYRLSPVQPKPDKWLFYQFVRTSIGRIIEIEMPVMYDITSTGLLDTKLNPRSRKEIERIALDNKWIYRRHKLDAYLKNNPNCLSEYMFKTAKETMCMYSSLPIYLRHPNGNICYERYMLSTDPGYCKGMSVIADIDDETIYMKHFDNVVYNAMNKGYKRLDEKEALKPVIRNKKLEQILGD